MARQGKAFLLVKMSRCTVRIFAYSDLVLLLQSFIIKQSVCIVMCHVMLFHIRSSINRFTVVLTCVERQVFI